MPKFDPPAGLCSEARDAWEDFWRDRPAALLTPTSKVVLVRWIGAIHRYRVSINEADLEPTLPGQNTTIINPLYRIAEQALKTIESCEKQLGIGTWNATALGLAAIAEQRNLTDLNAHYGGPESQDGGEQRAAVGPRVRNSDEPELDPRLLDGNDLLS